MRKGISIAAFVITTLIFAFIYWKFCPALSLGFLSSVLFIEAIITVIAVIIAYANEKDEDSSTNNEEDGIVLATGVLFVVIFVVIDLLGLLAGSTLFNSGTKYRQLGNGNVDNIHEVEYTKMIETIDTAQIPIVDELTARVLADKKLGEETALGSRVELGDGAIMDVNGEIMWVFPLDHKGFFKWNSNFTSFIWCT